MSDIDNFKDHDYYRRWAETKRAAAERLFADHVSPEELEFQGAGYTVMLMIDMIRIDSGKMSDKQYGVMRHEIIQQLFDIWAMEKKVAA